MKKALKTSPKNSPMFGEQEFLDIFRDTLAQHKPKGKVAKEQAAEMLRRSGILDKRGKLAKPYAA
ncbi:MAG: hypothetical protein PHS60_02470 [Zavarzinia sp.]|nr:hypothetical protein [Zavarzinia sp.]